VNSIDERGIRDQLERAVAPLDPVAPALDVLRRRGAHRRRMHVTFGAGMATVAAAVVALVLVPNGGSKKQVGITTRPARESLAAYAAAHHGKHVAGPVDSRSGYYGAFTVKRGIQVVHYVNGAWRPDGPMVVGAGEGRFVVKLSSGNAVIPGEPSFELHTLGGDVSYYGGVLRDYGARWERARFGTCGHHKLCYAALMEPYGHIVNGEFVSMQNDCTPNCAAGHMYRVTWRWNSSSDRFEAAATHREGRWANRP
jgi:hypothetical protein